MLFLIDGAYLADQASAQHLSGNQWGMMNETGNYPGQAWLWLYTFWYQIDPFKSSKNADALIWALMAVLSLAGSVLTNADHEDGAPCVLHAVLAHRAQQGRRVSLLPYGG